MTSTAVAAPATRGFSVRSSLKRNRRWALILSYACLILFAIFFLAPPYYMLVTSFKTNPEAPAFIARKISSPFA